MNSTQGIITAWKPDKGFGFIRPAGGGADVFVHIRDFGNISRVPKVDDAVTYQQMQGKDGRYRAADVRIAGVPRLAVTRSRPKRATNKTPTRSTSAKAISFVLAIVLLAFVYSRLHPILDSPPTQELSGVHEISAESGFSCQGKHYCSEMRSCEEAKYYLSSCPNTRMDGDNDGVPCEIQWCN